METDDNDVWEYTKENGEEKKERPLENERHIMQFWYAVNNEIDNGKWRRNTKKATKITLHRNRNRNRKMHSNHNKNGNKIIVCAVFVSFSPLRRIQSVHSTYLHYSTYYHSLCVSVSLPFISRNFICFLFLNETICINLLRHTHAHTPFSIVWMGMNQLLQLHSQWIYSNETHPILPFYPLNTFMWWLRNMSPHDSYSYISFVYWIMKWSWAFLWLFLLKCSL